MSIQPVWQGRLDFFSDLPVVVEASAAQLSSDAGLLPLRQFDERIALTTQFAAALHDPRDPELIEHSFLDMVRARLYGILAGYEDQNDHDVLRCDPVFKLIADRSPEGADLASQPTLSRFENAIDIPSLKRLRDVLIDQFVASFATPPAELTLDLDAVDDPAHGHQQLVLFHAYFEQYQYFPAFITCADNDQVLAASLRAGAVHAAMGCDDDLEYVVLRLRQSWPQVRLRVRGDAAYGVPWMYAVCERLDLEYSFGLASNAVLKRASDALLERAEQTYAATGVPQRLFDGFWYQAGPWPRGRWVIVKCEAHAQGVNRRFIVTNRPGAQVVLAAAYDDYAQRGESENRNKELKCDLAMDRTSDHRFKANYFRLYLHVAALNLLVRLRQEIAAPPPLVADEPPLEARSESQRRQYFRQRRRQDPLGEGQPCTWRSLLIKMAAEVVVSSRRVLVRLSSRWPHLPYFQHLCQHLASIPIPLATTSG
jgi:Transposase DDE domain group 1